MYGHAFSTLMLYSNMLDKSRTEQLWFKKKGLTIPPPWPSSCPTQHFWGTYCSKNTGNPRTGLPSHPTSALCPQHPFQPWFSMWQHGKVNASNISLPRTHCT